MATRTELLDTRDWYPGMGAGLEGLAPGEAVPAPPAAPVYTVTFLDRSARGYTARTHVQLDCEPLVWTKMEPNGMDGLTRRTWVREYGDAGTVYREIAPALFVPTAYQPGKPPKAPKGRVVPDVEAVEEEWA